MAYGTVKVDNITFTNGGIDQTVTVSGIVQSISGNITATGTIQAATIIGTSTVSGATVTGNAGVFTTVTGGSAGFTTVTGTTVTGTTANFNVGTFTSQVSGATVTGNLAQFTSVTGGTAGFTTVTGTTVTGTTANFITLSGTTVTGNAGQFTTITGTSAGFTTVTGTTITGSVGNFGSGSAAAPSVSVGTTDNGVYSPGTDQVAISTNGTERMRITSTGQMRLAGAGITFNGDTASANELDDYEEGSWTPTGIGNPQAVTAYYVKTGKMCLVSFWAFTTNGVNTVGITGSIGGLPFSAVNDWGGTGTYYLHVDSTFTLIAAGVAFAKQGTSYRPEASVSNVNSSSSPNGTKVLSFTAVYRTA